MNSSPEAVLFEYSVVFILFAVLLIMGIILISCLAGKTRREGRKLSKNLRKYAGSVGLKREAQFYLGSKIKGPMKLKDLMSFIDAHRKAWFEHVETDYGNYSSHDAWNKAFTKECCAEDSCPIH